MKRAAVPMALLLLGSPLALGSGAASSPDREAIVYVQSSAIHEAPGRNGAQPVERVFAPGSRIKAHLALRGASSARRVLRWAPGPESHRLGSGDQSEIGLDRSRLLCIEFPGTSQRDAFLEDCKDDPAVLIAGPNQQAYKRGEPSDTRFPEQWNMRNVGQSGGAVGADVGAVRAWDFAVGNAAEAVAIIDMTDGDPFQEEISQTNPDLSGRVLGSPGFGMHATMIAGVIAAKGNNGQGVAGLNWNTVVKSYVSDGTLVNVLGDIDAALSDGFKILNLSIGVPGANEYLDVYFQQAQMSNVFSALALPEGTHINFDYPNILRKGGMLNVAATTDLDAAAAYSPSKAYVDVAAPGGNATGDVARDILTTFPGNAYGFGHGTSLAAPHAAGAASLLRRFATDSLGMTLSNNDLANILKYSADNLGPAGWDDRTGWGRINVRRGIQWLRMPTKLAHYTASGGSTVGGHVSQQVKFVSANCVTPSGVFGTHRFEVQVHVTFPVAFSQTPYVWGNAVASTGATQSGLQFGERWCEVVPGSVTPTGCTLRTYTFRVFGGSGNLLGYCPGEPEDLVFGYTVMPAQGPDEVTSYYTPEADSSGTLLTGSFAVRHFKICPNNDAGDITRNARIRIVLKDASGSPISGVPAGDVYALFNGGTAAQGFTGFGADSIIANATWNGYHGCPTITAIFADAPTDVNGVTYITLRGATPGSPGVATRDPNRKWGHYDSDIPVFASGLRLFGRFTAGGSNGSYVLRIKNLDWNGGLGAEAGETVSLVDWNPFVHGYTGPQSYWMDFDTNGAVGPTDINLIQNHVGHDCDSPNSP